MQKLEWCGYPMVKNFEDIFIRFGATPERDGQTDRQTDGHRVTAIAALCITQSRTQRHVPQCSIALHADDRNHTSTSPLRLHGDDRRFTFVFRGTIFTIVISPDMSCKTGQMSDRPCDINMFTASETAGPSGRRR